MHSTFPHRFTKRSPIGAVEAGIAFIWENTATTATKALRERATVYSHLLGASILEDKCDLVRSALLFGPATLSTLPSDPKPRQKNPKRNPLTHRAFPPTGSNNESRKPHAVWSVRYRLT